MQTKDRLALPDVQGVNPHPVDFDEARRIREVGQVGETFGCGMNNGHEFLWANQKGLAIIVVCI
jgi:hypothetical protein